MSCSVAARSALTTFSVSAPGARLRERRDLRAARRSTPARILLGEAVALGERRDLVGVDAIDQPVEMLAQAGVGPRAVGRFEQHARRRGRTRLARGPSVPSRSSRSPARKCCCDASIRTVIGIEVAALAEDRRRGAGRTGGGGGARNHGLRIAGCRTAGRQCRDSQISVPAGCHGPDSRVHAFTATRVWRSGKPLAVAGRETDSHPRRRKGQHNPNLLRQLKRLKTNRVFSPRPFGHDEECCSSPKSRAAGVTIVRSPMTSLRPWRIACRTSSSQTKSSGFETAVGGVGAGLASAGAAGGAAFSPLTGPAGLDPARHVTPGRQELVDASGQGPGGDAAAAPGQPAPSASRPPVPAPAPVGASARDRRHLVGQPLDVQQVPRRDVVRRDVAAVAAAAERHRRLEPVVSPIDPCVVGVLTTMRNAGFFRPNSRITSSFREWIDIVWPMPP